MVVLKIQLASLALATLIPTAGFAQENPGDLMDVYLSGDASPDGLDIIAKLQGR